MNITEWATDTRRHTTTLATRWPKLTPALHDLAHPTGNPTCPPPNPKRPELQACLACQLTRAHPRANAMTATSDGLRSPSLEPGSRPIGSHSDPTWNAVVATIPANNDQPAMHTAASNLRNATHSLHLALSALDQHQARSHVHDARREATQALSALHRLLPPTNTLRRLQPTGDPGCASCKRIGTYTPTRTQGSTHCRRCEDWHRAKGKLPPVGILEAWRDSKRLTTAIVERAEADERWRTKRKRKRAS